MDTCPTCQSPFGKRQRCYACKPARQRTGETRQCQHCGASFYAPAAQLKVAGGGRFCSRACKHDAARKPKPEKQIAPRETRPCFGCGKPITKLVSQIHGERWFCDRVCQKPFMPLGASASKEPNPLRGQQETRPCVTCGEPVTRYLSQIRTTQAWSCSKTCAATAKSKREIAAGTWKRPQKPRKGDTVACLMCGTEFYRQPAYIKQNRRYCSTPCWNAAQRVDQVEKTCPQCGKSFSVRPSETFLVHCSRACQVKAKTKMATGRMHNGRPVLMNAQGYITLYEPDHPAANKHSGRVLEHRLIVEREIGRHLTSKETINHIDHNRSNNAPENLEILSASDHGKETNAYTRRQRAEVLAELQAYREKFGKLTD